MLIPRIIPCLLVSDGALVKTVGFDSPNYVGDPINAVRIFNEKEVDELIVVDISATASRKPPDFDLIAKLAMECRMPLCYGGGVSSVDQIERIVALGVEKVALGTAAILSPDLIAEAARRVGSQSVVAVLDVKRVGLGAKCELRYGNGSKVAPYGVEEFSRLVECAGAGEILINSIDNDGRMRGYDLEMCRRVRASVSVPITILGGAGSLDDFVLAAREFGSIGLAAGSLFIYKGRFRAVLISYLDRSARDKVAIAAV